MRAIYVRPYTAPPTLVQLDGTDEQIRNLLTEGGKKYTNLRTTIRERDGITVVGLDDYKSEGTEQDLPIADLPHLIGKGTQEGITEDLEEIDPTLELLGACRYKKRGAARIIKHGPRAGEQEDVTWICSNCGHVETYEADGPYENSVDVCPHCGRPIMLPGEILVPLEQRHQKAVERLIDDTGYIWPCCHKRRE